MVTAAELQCPYCHKQLKNPQALASHLAYKHGAAVKVEREKMRSNGDVKKALAHTQENVGIMAQRLAQMSKRLELTVSALMAMREHLHALHKAQSEIVKLLTTVELRKKSQGGKQ